MLLAAHVGTFEMNLQPKTASSRNEVQKPDRIKTFLNPRPGLEQTSVSLGAPRNLLHHDQRRDLDCNPRMDPKTGLPQMKKIEEECGFVCHCIGGKRQGDSHYRSSSSLAQFSSSSSRFVEERSGAIGAESTNPGIADGAA